MTGFARCDGSDDQYRWSWELKSVNGRGLDLRFRLPPGFDFLEPGLRKAAQAALARGNVSINLSMRRIESAQTLRVNRAVLDQYLAALDEIASQRNSPPPEIAQLLSLRGVIESGEEEPSEESREALGKALAKDFDTALGALAAARGEEGDKLATIVATLLDEIESLTAEATTIAETQPGEAKARIEEQLAALLGPESPVSEERLAQEVALLATKSDVREELDRLRAHVEAARALMSEGGAIGRKLDFLCQEFNREANTTCSKATHLDLTRVGLALKAEVERLREQVQNIE